VDFDSCTVTCVWLGVDLLLFHLHCVGLLLLLVCDMCVCSGSEEVAWRSSDGCVLLASRFRTGGWQSVIVLYENVCLDPASTTKCDLVSLPGVIATVPSSPSTLCGQSGRTVFIPVFS
jgi:hypothetical protein